MKLHTIVMYQISQKSAKKGKINRDIHSHTFAIPLLKWLDINCSCDKDTVKKHCTKYESRDSNSSQLEAFELLWIQIYLLQSTAYPHQSTACKLTGEEAKAVL